MGFYQGRFYNVVFTEVMNIRNHIGELRSEELYEGRSSQLYTQLHRYRRGQGFESSKSLNFFSAFFSQLPNLRI